MKILLNLFCVLLVFGLFTSCDDSNRFEALDATVVNPCLGTGFSGVAHILDGEPPENVAFPTNDNKDIIESTYLNSQDNDFSNATESISINIPKSGDDVWDGGTVTLAIQISSPGTCRQCCSPRCGAGGGEAWSSIFIEVTSYQDLIDALDNDLVLELRCTCSNC